MSRVENTIYCDLCGAEITWQPLSEHGKDVCCQDCLEGRGCECGEDLDEGRKGRAGGHQPNMSDWGRTETGYKG
jgi:hypothetical protein